MTLEACESLMAKEETIQGVIQDGGRYTKQVLNEKGSYIRDTIKERKSKDIPFDYGSSANVDGLQIADVICNTALRHLRDGSDLETSLINNNNIAVRFVELNGRAPDWVCFLDRKKAAG